MSAAAWSEGQKALVEHLWKSGATSAEAATRIERRVAVDAAELATLIDSGVVREASRDRYYIHEPSIKLERRNRLIAHMDRLDAEPEGAQPIKGRQFVKMLIFWLIMIAIPLVLIQLLGSNR